MPDPRAFDEAWAEAPPFDSPRLSGESLLEVELFDLYALLERNAAYAIRTAEAEAERDVILREIAELEALVS